MARNKPPKNPFLFLLPPAFWLGVWQLAALLVERSVEGRGNELLLPYPATVLAALIRLCGEASFWEIVLASLLRILMGLALGVALGALLAGMTCASRWCDRLLSPAIRVVRATPVVSFILLVLLWTGRDWVPVVIAALMVLPVVWANVCAGIRGTDPLLLRTAKVFGFSRWRTLRRVYLPSVMPHFLAACRTALGLGWKAGIAAEVLTVPAVSMGKRLMEAKQYVEVTDLFAWTVMVVLCSLIIEKVLMAAVGRLGKRYAVGGEDK